VRRYGVVLTPELNVNDAATAALRAKIAAERPPLQMFERGGTIEEIKSRAKAETGFEPPSAPKWPHWAKQASPQPIHAIAAE
jgi:N-methylhydantoinase B